MKFGIIGTNFVSEFFMNGANEHALCDVVAVSDVTMASAKAFADKHNIEHSFDDYKKMCDANICDAVYIAVPNGLHSQISLYFLQRKIAVFCEKPLAANIDQVTEMIECAKKNNTYLQEGLIPLYNPNFKILKDSLPMVGKIRQATFNFSKYSSRYDAYLRNENPTTFRADLANGAIMDLGVYIFADVIGLWGKPVSIEGRCTLLDTKADIAGTSIFEYPEFNVSLSYSKASDTNNICEICGELGILTIDFPSQPKTITFINRLTQEKTILSVPVFENFYYEIDEMIKCVNQGKIQSDLCPFETSIAVHDCLTQARKMANIVFPCDK